MMFSRRIAASRRLTQLLSAWVVLILYAVACAPLVSNDWEKVWNYSDYYSLLAVFVYYNITQFLCFFFSFSFPIVKTVTKLLTQPSRLIRHTRLKRIPYEVGIWGYGLWHMGHLRLNIWGWQSPNICECTQFWLFPKF